MHFLDCRDCQWANDAKPKPFGVGMIPDALGQLRILHFPVCGRRQAGRAAPLAARHRRPAALTGPADHTIPMPERDPDRLKEIVFDKLVEKMRFGRTDEIQLQAANLVGQLLGMFQNGHAPHPLSADSDRDDDDPADEPTAARDSVTEDLKHESVDHAEVEDDTESISEPFERYGS